MKKELLEKAKKYGIEVDDFENDEELEKAIKDYEEENGTDDDNDDDDDDDPTTLKEKIEYWKNEAKKAFEDRDNVKKERRRIQKKIKELEDELKERPSSDKIKELNEELEELKNFKDEMDEKLEEEERKKLSEKERLELEYTKKMEKLESNFTKKLDEMTKKLEEKDEALSSREENIKSLRKIKLQNEIMSVAGKLKAFNPKQIVGILSSEFEYDSDLDKFVHYKRDEKGKLVDEFSVEDRVTEFLKDPDNTNLVETTKKTGTDHNDHSYHKDTRNRKKKSDKYDPNDDKIKEKADERGLSPEEYIDTLVMRDERLAKIRGDKSDT